MKSNELKIKSSLGDRLTVGICSFIVLICVFSFLYPLIYVLISSITTSTTITWSIKDFSLDGYRMILKEPRIMRGFFNSLLYTSVGTMVSMTMTILVSYALSQSSFKLAKVVALLFTFTMYFGGGMIPTFLVVKKLGLLNTMWSLILPSCMSVYNIYLLKAHFENKIPKELQGAAMLEGCGHWKYLICIVIPMSRSFLSVIAFYYIVSYWNSYFTAMIYIYDLDKLPLASVLNNLLIKNQNLGQTINYGLSVQQRQLMEYAAIVFSTVPVLICFILIRKHFKADDFEKVDKK